jgi:O-antigen biosynthesis protein
MMAWHSDPEALRTAGLRALQQGVLETAFACADRLCRTQAFPSASDWLARAAVHHRLGCAGDFRADLDEAVESGWTEPLVLRAVAALHPDPSMRREACRALIGSQRASEDDLRVAFRALTALGEIVATRVWRTADDLRGWVACRSEATPDLVLSGEVPTPIRLGTPRDHGFGPAWRLWPFAIGAEPDRPLTLTVRAGGRVIASVSDIPRVLTARSSSRPSVPPSIHADVAVIVPVFGDPDTLRRCLESLRAQQTRCRVHHVIVDDCAPDAAVTTLGQDFCGAVGGTFVRLVVNAGFAGAINAGLARIASGDVLILNSDVVLPATAIERLRQASRLGEQVGTVAPLSNDAGSSSFPIPFERNPLLDESAAAAVDDAAERSNDGIIVDVLTNLGSCFYVTEACRRAVGLFSPAYGRGYYEDVDFCLRATAVGLRNVVAPSIYVSHASSRSFGSAKRQLAVENRIVLETRFPGFDEAEAAYMRADPIAPFRKAISETLEAKSEVLSGTSTADSSCTPPAADRHVDALAVARVPRSRPALGIVMPEPCARSERLVLALARSVRRSETLDLVVFGSCLDEGQLLDIGNTWVHGAVAPRDLPALVRKTGVNAVFSPDPDRHLDLLRAAAQPSGLPKAFFAASAEGRSTVEPLDLMLPDDLGDREVAERVGAWCGSVCAPPNDPGA